MNIKKCYKDHDDNSNIDLNENVQNVKGMEKEKEWNLILAIVKKDGLYAIQQLTKKQTYKEFINANKKMGEMNNESKYILFDSSMLSNTANEENKTMIV